MSEFNEAPLALAEQAVELVEADVSRTVGVDMRFDVSIRQIDRDDPDYEILVVSFRGSYQTPVMISVRNPESTAELADNMQDHITERLHAAWPLCPIHDRGLYARLHDGQAVWYCRAGEHVVSRIGGLGL